ncbi:hypothetical protein [Commensalibacter oyaizuii]|uniref:CHAD domain-containing protein n=1 Tax=Commensalibacter oyaizuii TaxID=3043873 RepID=A0ABT6Q4N0_9PROT|nr:hypothetical protein [Commensalibacter sp. TBRC 16381]MDI2091454.1 hypothetical protein [Commensalibacter sp. TBRC 16381]
MFNFSRSQTAKQIVDFDRFHFSERQCAQLYAMICVDDEINLDVNLPETIKINYTQAQLIESFLICRQLWLEGIIDRHFPKIVSHLYRTCEISLEDKVIYKMIRAKFKHLCYAYRAFDSRHQRPFLLGHTTGLLGVIQDGFKNNKNSVVKPNAFLLKLLWNEQGLSLLRQEVYRFYPCDLEGFIFSIRKRACFIRHQIETKATISAHDFHSLRKHMSMFAAVYGTFDVLYPSPYHHQVFQYLATINGLMGNFHDELIERKLNQTQNYFFDHFEIPKEILSRLTVFTDRFLTVF